MSLRMHKATMSITLVLTISSLTWAGPGVGVDMQQLFEIGAMNSVALSGLGDHSAVSTNVVSAANRQQSDRGRGRIHTFQYEDGTLYQVAGVGGFGHGASVEQNGRGLGTQHLTQNGGYNDLGNQSQDLGANLTSATVGHGHHGFLGSMQGFVGHQVQVTLTPYGMSINVTRLHVQDRQQTHR